MFNIIYSAPPGSAIGKGCYINGREIVVPSHPIRIHKGKMSPKYNIINTIL